MCEVEKLVFFFNKKFLYLLPYFLFKMTKNYCSLMHNIVIFVLIYSNSLCHI
jgi:hypothetical protein